MKKITLTLLLLSFFSLISAQQVFLVPSTSHPTIQAGIDSAANGDTVLVAPGTYSGQGNDNLSFQGKSIALISTQGPNATILACRSNVNGVNFTNYADSSTVFSGFTVLGAKNGISFSGLSNFSWVRPQVTNCIIDSSTSYGINIGNFADPQITHCTIKNSQDHGIYIFSLWGRVLIQSCKIIQNSNYGIYYYRANLVRIKNTLIAKNDKGIYRELNTLTRKLLLTNCTITQNKTSSSGKALYDRNVSDSLIIKNSIIWGNWINSVSETYDLGVLPFSSYSLFEGGLPGKGNMDTHPLFVDTLTYHLATNSPALDKGHPLDMYNQEPLPNGDRINLGAYGNTSEAQNSPTGPTIVSFLPDTASPAGGILAQLTGRNLGTQSGNVTIGGNLAAIQSWRDTLVQCFVPAHPAGLVGVKLTTLAGKVDSVAQCFTYNGATVLQVPNQYPTIQAAIDFAREGDTVLVAPGAYAGAGNVDLSFRGKKIVVTSEKGPDSTILVCNINYGIRFAPQDNKNAVFSGFTISGAFYGVYANGSFASHVKVQISNCIIDAPMRDGIYALHYSDLSISNCTIKNGQEDGIYLFGFVSSATIESCQIYHNRRRGIHIYAGGDFWVKNTLIIGNRRGVHREYLQGSNLHLHHCTIAHNETTTPGSAVLDDGRDSLVIRNSIIWDNEGSTPHIVQTTNASLEILFSNIQGGWSNYGNIDTDPFFRDPLKLDYHLSCASPCIDAGHPADPFSQEPGAHGGRVNMGSYGNTPEATSFCQIPPPKMVSHFPSSACIVGGTVIDISGRNLGSIQGSISIGGQTATVTAWSDSLVQCLSPALSVGTYDVILTDNLGNKDTLFQTLIAAPSEQYIKGDVSGIWSAHGCPQTYIIVGNVRIPSGQSLIIEPGVTVLVDTDSAGLTAEFLVEGTLQAMGTVSDSITFSVRPGQSAPGVWRGIRLNSQIVNLAYCRVEYAQAGITINQYDPKVNHCLIRHNSNNGIFFTAYGATASGEVSHCELSHNGQYGISVHAFCTQDNAYARPLIYKNQIKQNQAGGIRVTSDGNSSRVCLFSWCHTHLAYSEPTIEGNIISQNEGFALYTSSSGSTSRALNLFNWFIGNSRPRLENNIMYENAGGIKTDGWPLVEAGLKVSHTAVTAVNNTFWNNDSLKVLANDSSFVNIHNSIMRGDTGQIQINGASQVTVSYSNISPTASGTGNINQPAQFVSTLNKNFRLGTMSPCIDAGDDTLVNAAFDYDDNLRIWDGDNNGQASVDMGAYEFDSPTQLQLTLSPTNILCAGDSLGQLTALVNGGLRPYTYLWNDPTNSTDSIISGLRANRTYQVQVMDASGQTATDSLRLIEPLPLLPFSYPHDPPCASDSVGRIDLTMNGGAMPYTFLWSNGNQHEDPDSLTSGWYTVEVHDANGCRITDTVQIRSQDQTPPDMLCQPVTLSLDALGEASLTPSQMDAGSSDNCGNISLTISQSNFDCLNIGQQPVVLTGTDTNGNIGSCSSAVTIEDTLAPTMACQAVTISLNANGVASLTSHQVDGGSIDNCSIANLAISQSSFSCGDAGTNTVLLTATDAANNSASCQAVVTVADQLPPTMVCQAVSLTLDANGSASLTANQADGGSTDNCGMINLTISQNNYDCSNLGTNSVTLTATDAHGNSNTCQAVVVVSDSIAPIMACQAASLSLDATGIANLSPNQVDGGSTDNCAISNLAISPSSFACSDTGIHPVTLTATDAHGNTAACQAMVIVSDQMAPSMVCQPVNLQLNIFGAVGLSTSQVDGGTTDNCGIASLALSQTIFRCADIGTNAVVLTATDIHGNVAACQAMVTVSDQTAPSMACLSVNLMLDASGNASLTVSQVDGGTMDNCGIANLTLSQNSFSCADTGVHLITLSATDVNGNSATCQASVTVSDSMAPTMNCQPLSLFIDSNGIASLASNQIDAGSFDNCGLKTIIISQSLFDCGDVGQHIVTLTGVDFSGNLDSCQAVVTVIDTIPAPTIQLLDSLPYCEGDDLTLAGPIGFLAYEWSNGSSAPIILIGQADTLSLRVSYAPGCWTPFSSTISIPPPILLGKPLIMDLGDSLRCSVVGDSYIWMLDGDTIPLMTQTIPIDSNGLYTVIVYKGPCESDVSDGFPTHVGINRYPLLSAFELYPNPNQGYFFISGKLDRSSLIELRILTPHGQLLFQKLVHAPEGKLNEQIHLENLAEGIYFIQFRSNDRFTSRKFEILR